MKTSKPGLLSGRGGSPSKSDQSSIGMKNTGGKKDMDRQGGKAKIARANEQPSKRNKATNPRSGYVR